MKLIALTAVALSIGALSSIAHADTQSQEYISLALKDKSEQDEAKGFIDGQGISGSTRNWYSHEHATRGPLWRYHKSDGTRVPTNSRDNWVQGAIVNYRSGFTQGTVGLAVEAAGYNAIALQRGRKAVAGPSNRTLADSDGDVVGQWSKMGLANIKARVSNTTVTLGRQSVETPMLAYIGNRALPSSFQGVFLHSAEFDNLSFDVGTFDRVSPRSEQSLSKFRTEYGANGAQTDRASTAGLKYQPLKSLNTSFYATKVDDFWNQYYFGANHVLGDSAVLRLSTGLNYYKTVDEGRKKMGEIDNDTYSLSLGLTHAAHTLSASWQQVNGDEYFDYLHETNGIYLANSMLSDYNGPNEKSLQLSYAIDMAPYGVPGLNFMLWNVRGWGVDGTHYRGTAYNVNGMDGESHYEWGIGTGYAVQSGPLKSSSIRVSYIAHRASEAQADGSLNELRIVTSIPFNIL